MQHFSFSVSFCTFLNFILISFYYILAARLPLLSLPPHLTSPQPACLSSLRSPVSGLLRPRLRYFFSFCGFFSFFGSEFVQLFGLLIFIHQKLVRRLSSSLGLDSGVFKEVLVRRSKQTPPPPPSPHPPSGRLFPWPCTPLFRFLEAKECVKSSSRGQI